MSCLGVHFSLDCAQVEALLSLEEGDRVYFVKEEFEESLWSADKSRAQETGNAWDAIHRALTDGRLEWENGTYPLNHVILGGVNLYERDDYILGLKSPAQVKDIAAAIAKLTKEQFRGRFDAIEPSPDALPLTGDNFDDTWYCLEQLISFYDRAAAEGYHVLFTADQ